MSKTLKVREWETLIQLFPPLYNGKRTRTNLPNEGATTNLFSQLAQSLTKGQTCSSSASLIFSEVCVAS